jgi:hypothetical protein
MPGVPAGTFTTAGNKGQCVTVVPGQDLRIVRTCVDPDGKRFMQNRLVADVVRSLGQCSVTWPLGIPSELARCAKEQAKGKA